MIQRIQSIYLLLISVLAITFLSGSLLNFADNAGTSINVTISGIEQGTSSQGFSVIEMLLPLTIDIILIAILSLVTIFIFRKRNIQALLVKILIALIVFLIIACVHLIYMIITKHSMGLVPGIKMVFPVIMLVLSLLAHRGIKKDNDLVKSYDRLR
jgi:hypothetical protein